MTPNFHAIGRYGAGLALVLAGALATTAVHAAPGAPEMMPTHGPMMGPGGFDGGSMMGGMLPRMLDRVNATPEQRAQIKQILEAQAGERQAQRDAARALRDEALALLAQPAIDASALEALRQKQLAAHDAASKRMTGVMLAVASVLTPAQRKQIADDMKQRSEMMQRHYRERRALDAPRS
jgi:Spy/CpxP family protein refolding chaperone